MTDDEYQHDDTADAESGVPELELPPNTDDTDDEPGDEEEPDGE